MKRATSQQTTRAVATLVVAALALMVVAGAGCSSTLETGYKPRMLGSSADMRRGYYAERFTPEAQKAKQYEQDFGTPTPSRPRGSD